MAASQSTSKSCLRPLDHPYWCFIQPVSHLHTILQALKERCAPQIFRTWLSVAAVAGSVSSLQTQPCPGTALSSTWGLSFEKLLARRAAGSFSLSSPLLPLGSKTPLFWLKRWSWFGVQGSSNLKVVRISLSLTSIFCRLMLKVAIVEFWFTARIVAEAPEEARERGSAIKTATARSGGGCFKRCLVQAFYCLDLLSSFGGHSSGWLRLRAIASTTLSALFSCALLSQN